VVIIIADPVSGCKWKLKPLSDGLNYQIYKTPQTEVVNGKVVHKKNGKEIDPDKFVPQELYASSLEHAVRLVVESALKLDETEISAKDWKSVAKAVDKRVKSITAEVMSE
jgi:hypothetical protein